MPINNDDTHGQTFHYCRQGTTTECWEEGSFIWLVDTLYTAMNMRTLMGNAMGYVEFMESDTGTDLSNGGDSIPIIPSNTGFVLISTDADTIISGSLFMCSPYSGQKLHIMRRGDGAKGGVNIVFSGEMGGILSGVPVYDDSILVSLSSFSLMASVSCHAWVTFVSPHGDYWAVLDYGHKSVGGNEVRAIVCIPQVE